MFPDSFATPMRQYFFESTAMDIQLPPDLQPKTEDEKLVAESIMRRISGTKPFRHSPKLTDYQRMIGRFLIASGYRQHDIAAALAVNQGRLSEIKHGP
jgi:hypothetical protein